MSVLIQKLRKSRENSVTAGKFRFTVRRPTDMEAVSLSGTRQSQGDILQRFVVGWSAVTELDIIPGGTGVDVAFDAELFMEWVADRPELWQPLVSAVLDAYDTHQKKLDDSLGKPDAG